MQLSCKLREDDTPFRILPEVCHFGKSCQKLRQHHRLWRLSFQEYTPLSVCTCSCHIYSDST